MTRAWMLAQVIFMMFGLTACNSVRFQPIVDLDFSHTICVTSLLCNRTCPFFYTVRPRLDFSPS